VAIAKVPVVTYTPTTTNVANSNGTASSSVSANVSVNSNTASSNAFSTSSSGAEVAPTCGTGEVWNNVSKTCICSNMTPYRTLAGICIACNAPNKWSTSINKCLEPQIACKSNFIYDPSAQSCICPKNLPFSDGQKCQSCFLPMYWNNLDKICRYCP
jgi:hypothetical protein